jgi:hypothetical protein
MTALEITGRDAPTPTVGQADRLRSVVEFNCPFTVINWFPFRAEGIYGPEGVTVDRDTLEPLDLDSEWEIIGGYSADHSWIMHESQFIGGALAADLLANPGTYVVTTVDVETDPEDEDEDTCAGWAILKWQGGDE